MNYEELKAILSPNSSWCLPGAWYRGDEKNILILRMELAILRDLKKS
jgi:hypothetical protein